MPDYYFGAPADPAKIKSYLSAVVDPIVSVLLEKSGSIGLKFLAQKIGVGNTAEFLSAQIGIAKDKDNDTITTLTVGQLQFTINTAFDYAISSQLEDLLAPILAAALGDSVAYVIAVPLTASIAAQFIMENMLEPAADAVVHYINPPVRIEIAGAGFGAVYSAGLGVLPEIDAVMALVDAASNYNLNNMQIGVAVGSHVQVYLDGAKGDGYDLLDPNILQTIADAISSSVAAIEGWTGVDASGAAASNSNLFVPYSRGSSKFNILETLAQVGLQLPTDRGRVSLTLPANAILVNGKSIGVASNSSDIRTVLAIGPDSASRLDLSAYQNVYAFGGLGRGLTLRGGAGDNVLWASNVDDAISGQATGTGDTVYGAGSSDIIEGSSGNDTIYGGSGEDRIYGGAGDDLIHAGGGNVSIFGGLGNDTIYAGNGSDYISAGSDQFGATNDTGPNTLFAGSGNDVIYGAYGQDLFTVGTGNSYMDGGPETDTLNYFYDSTDPIVISSGGAAPDGHGAFGPGAFLTLTADQKTDVVHSIEKIFFAGNIDIQIAKDTDLTGVQVIDGGPGINTLNFKSIDKEYHFDTNTLDGFDTKFNNFKKVTLGDVTQDAKPTSQYTEIDGTKGEYTFDLANWSGKVLGGTGDATAEYTTSDDLNVTVASDNGKDKNGDQIVKVADGSDNSSADLSSVQSIDLGTGANTVNVDSFTTFPIDPAVDLGATGSDSGDTVDLSKYDGNVDLSSAHPDDDHQAAVEFYGDQNFSKDLGLGFTNFNTLILGKGDNKVQLYTADDPYLTTVQTGDGDNIITSDIVNLTINLGSGKNIIGDLAQGTIVNAQGGQNKFLVSDDVQFNGLTPTDEIFADGILLRGAVGQIGSDDPWIVGPNGTRYGLNTQGDLVIEDTAGDKTYVSNYQGGPDLPFSQQTAGIFVGEAETLALRILELLRPHIGTMMTYFKLGNELLYAKTGKTFFNSDPLVLDLSGTGINVTALSDTAPMLDMRGDGFAVHTGWVGASDGILVLQQAGETGTPTISEMFGGQGAEGFAALASYDSNGDGIIDANDSIYSQLRVWVDRNDNGAVDSGELETLAQAGVASISLASTTQTGDTQAGNTITATGSFTRSDGTTGAIADVNFNVDTFHSTYLGDTTVSAAAAAMPDLKGYGTLADLRVAMTLDPTLIDTINANLPNLDVPDLAALRAAALPIFVAWAKAVKQPDADGNLQSVDPAAGHSDVAILVHTDSNGVVTVDDFAYRLTDGSWGLAGGGGVKDGDGNTIAQPTLAQVMAQTPTSGDSWQKFSAAEIGVIERLYGQPFPIDQMPTNPTATLAAMSNFMTGALTMFNLDALRLAMQGPLAGYFPGIAYDPVSDSFTATTDGELTPMYQAIFNAAPSDAAGATAWLVRWTPTIDAVLGDFVRGSGQSQATGQKVTYGYQFASMVRAYEASSLPLDIGAVATALGVPAGEVVTGGSTLTGPDLPSIYYLAGGDQTVTGGHGLNNFVLGGVFGHDTIIDDEPALSGSDLSILRLTNVRSTDVTATRSGLDLILSVNGTSEQVTVKGEFTGVRLSFNGANFNDNVGVAQISFSDGVLWDMPDIAKAVSRPDPTDGTVTGTPGMDVLDGGVGGNNTLSGGDGSDIYAFGLGYGHDTIQVGRTDPFNYSIDLLQFGAGIARSDLIFSRQGNSNDLQVAIKAPATSSPSRISSDRATACSASSGPTASTASGSPTTAAIPGTRSSRCWMRRTRRPPSTASITPTRSMAGAASTTCRAATRTTAIRSVPGTVSTPSRTPPPIS
jgi:Ca2+-binding RTX toxin-like protein